MSSTTIEASAATIKSVGQKWWLLGVFGVITLILGIVLTFKPGKSVHAIAAIFGIWLLILGVVRLIQAIGATGERRTGLLLFGLLSILISLLLLHHTTATVSVLGFIVGLFWTVGGAAEIIRGFNADDGNVNTPIIVLGCIATFVGILCLVIPSLSLSILCVIVGLGMIAYGIVEMAASLHLRALKVASDRPVHSHGL